MESANLTYVHLPTHSRECCNNSHSMLNGDGVSASDAGNGMQNQGAGLSFFSWMLVFLAAASLHDHKLQGSSAGDAEDKASSIQGMVCNGASEKCHSWLPERVLCLLLSLPDRRDSGTGDKEQEGSSTKGAEAAVAAEVRAEALNAALAKTEAELQNVTER
eukprot:1139352-Pelagomonas_calceolata.AAC.3